MTVGLSLLKSMRINITSSFDAYSRSAALASFRFSLLKSREMSEVMEISSRSMISGAVSPDLLHSLSYKHPSSTTKIFKEECMWCFNTPLHPGYFFVNLIECLRNISMLHNIGSFSLVQAIFSSLVRFLEY